MDCESCNWKRIDCAGWLELWCPDCGRHTIDGEEYPRMSFHEFRMRSLTIDHDWKPDMQEETPSPGERPRVALDFETDLIGPGTGVVPEPVCYTWAVRNGADVEASLVASGDPDFWDTLWELMNIPDVELVLQGGWYDLSVICRHKPEFEPRLWEMLENGQITDTSVREKLLNLSTHGKLKFQKMPDGSNVMLKYGMDALARKHLGVDLSADKDEEDSARTNFAALKGMPGSEYPPYFLKYAKNDAIYTLLISEAQDAMVRSESGPASFSTQYFHTMAAFALRMITVTGMRVDPEQVAEVERMLAEELAEDKLDLLIAEGVLRPATPSRPHSRQALKAWGLLVAAECRSGAQPEGYDWSDVTAEEREALEEMGIKFTKPQASSVDTKRLKALVEQTCRDYDVQLRHTPTGEVCCDSEMIEDLAPYDEALEQYKHRQSLQKLVSTEIPRMKWGDKVANVVHFPFDVLKETGRTSSFTDKLYPSGNGQQVDPRIRPCFKARDGYAICSADYSGLELGTTGQTTFEMFGYSVHRDKVIEGTDLHAYLGAQLAIRFDADFRDLVTDAGFANDPMRCYEAFVACKGHEDPAVNGLYRHYRRFAKPVGLGFPGGLGYETFVKLAKKAYGVDIAKIASEMPESRFAITETLLRMGKRKYKWTDPATEFSWTPWLRAMALAIELKEVWFKTYPEMVAYFEWVQSECDDPNNPIVGYRTDPETGESKPIRGLCYTSPMGMYRAGATYCAVANGRAMQTPAAEGAKIATINVVRACRDKSLGSPLYGCLPVDFIHDELLVEVPLERAHECAMELQRIMEESMAVICPDVPIKAEPALMLRWDKRAEPVFEEGVLVPWTPPETADTVVERDLDEVDRMIEQESERLALAS